MMHTNALRVFDPDTPSASDRQWAVIGESAPMLAATAHRYLGQIALSLRPGSVITTDAALRVFCRYLIEAHPDVSSFAHVGRVEIEASRRIWPPM